MNKVAYERLFNKLTKENLWMYVIRLLSEKPMYGKEIAEEIAKGVESGLRGKPITMPIVNGPYPRIFQVGVQTEPGRIKMTLPKEVARAHARVVRSERRKRRQGKSAALRESPEELRRFVFGRDPDYTRARRAAHRREQIDKGNYY